jgi:cytoskeletal protein RodZ
MNDAMHNSLSDGPSLTVGQRLRAARVERGLTQRDLATVTRIPAATIECLENDRFDEIHAEVFVRGFLRSCARELRVDADELLEQYRRQCGTPPLAAPAPAEARGAGSALLTPRAPRFVEAAHAGRIAYGVSIAALLLGLALAVLLVAGERTPDASASFQLDEDGAAWQPASDVGANSSGWRTN